MSKLSAKRISLSIPADDQAAQEFLSSQANASLSLRLLIRRFAQQHGSDRDLFEVAMEGLGALESAKNAEGLADGVVGSRPFDSAMS